MKIYTRTGDAGQTSLFGGSRVAKDDPRIEAYGTVDELNSCLGVARAAWPSSPADDELHRVQSDLFDIGAYLASPGSDRFHGVDPKRVDDLEHAIDEMEVELAPLKQFILPGGSPAAAQLHTGSRTHLPAFGAPWIRCGQKYGGRLGTRTPDPLLVRQVL